MPRNDRGSSSSPPAGSVELQRHPLGSQERPDSLIRRAFDVNVNLGIWEREISEISEISETLVMELMSSIHRVCHEGEVEINRPRGLRSVLLGAGGSMNLQESRGTTLRSGSKMHRRMAEGCWGNTESGHGKKVVITTGSRTTTSRWGSLGLGVGLQVETPGGTTTASKCSSTCFGTHEVTDGHVGITRR